MAGGALNRAESDCADGDGAGPEHAVRAAMAATTAPTASGKRVMQTGRIVTSVKGPWAAQEADREPRSSRSSLIARFG